MFWAPWIRELRAASRSFVLLAVVCLATLVATGATLPVLGRLVGGNAPHVCHCQVRPGHGAHVGCGCPICVPELRDQDGFGGQELVAKCGDDDPALRSLAIPAVASAGFVIASPEAWAADPLPVRLASSQWSTAPEIPPPIAPSAC